MRLRWCLIPALLTAIAACGETPDGGEEVGPARASQINAMEAAEQALPAPAGESAEIAQSEVAVAELLDRLGPVQIGMSVDDLRAAGMEVATDAPLPGTSCSYARLSTLPGTHLMLDGNKVVRIDVLDADHVIMGGLRVGMRERDALALLGPPVQVEAHPYNSPDGHYLSYHVDGAEFGLIAETDGQTVQSWRIGNWEQVQWIEGCA